MKINDLPDGTVSSFSKALGVHDKGHLNNTFYSFGANFTNINDYTSEPSDKQKYQKKRCSSLNKSMIDIKKTNEFFNAYHEEMGTNYLTKPPNAVMNDYTKNISQSIFTPGVHQIPQNKKL